MCCKEEDECRDYQRDGYSCSYDIAFKSQSIGLDYWLCPFETDLCGENSSITITDDGSETEISHNNNDDFVYNSVCSYEVKLPSSYEEESDFDSILIYAEQLDNSIVYISVGDSITSKSMAEVQLI